MKAALEDKLPVFFDETPEEHQRRVHPDLEATKKERIELEQRLQEKLDGQKAE
jgi:hypothetical protein